MSPRPRPGWSVTLIGVEALRAAGWATQVAYRWDVAIHPADHQATIPEQVLVRRRPPDWFHAMLPGLLGPRLDDELFRLRPAWALADLLAYEREDDLPSLFGGLSPADIEPFEVTPMDRADWAAACAAFGLDAEAEARWLVASGSTARLSFKGGR